MMRRAGALGGAAALVTWLASNCARHALLVTVLALALAGAATWYVTSHFAIDTDTSGLISTDLPWRQRDAAFAKAFPQHDDLIAIVIDGATPEIAEQATASLATRLARETRLLRTVRRPDAGPFFEREGLLLLPLAEINDVLSRMIAAEPFLAVLAADPTLRGLMDALGLMLEGARRDPATFATIRQPLSGLADAFEALAAGKVPAFSWRAMLESGKPDPRELRRFILVQPVLDYTALQPGARATAFIRAASREVGLASDPRVRVRLTGSVPLSDEEFGTLAQGAAFDVAFMVAGVLILLWLALRAGRLILAVLVSLMAGLALTAAFGLFVFGRFNLISVAFAVLFVGLGVDFGIQFCVACRAQRAKVDDAWVAVRGASGEIGGALALAAASTALGFYAFGPTAYRGVSELGIIAGTGMVLAFLTSITFLPALIVILRAPLKPIVAGGARIEVMDLLIQRWRYVVLALGVVLGIASVALLPHLRFDFNPLNLRSPDVESVSTLLDLSRNPETTPNTIDVLSPSLDAAVKTAQRLSALPEVDHALTLATFVPDDQDAKLAAIGDAALLLDPVAHSAAKSPASDADIVQALDATAQRLEEARASAPPDVAALMSRLGNALHRLAQGTPAQRERASNTLLPGLVVVIGQVRSMLEAQPVTLQTLPPDLVRDWVAPDGRARVEVYPKGDANDNAVLERFVHAVRQVVPEATGAPVSIQESSRTIVTAFIQAGVLALVTTLILLAIMLRHLQSVLLTVAPLLLAGLVTLGICVVSRFSLNFENIIALPLLFGIGVAFDIYFIMAWRAGRPHLLASSLARAVLFSALTTGTAFGSLWLSEHPGTSSMGKLLVLSLLSILATVLVFLPALLHTVRYRE